MALLRKSTIVNVIIRASPTTGPTAGSDHVATGNRRIVSTMGRSIIESRPVKPISPLVPSEMIQKPSGTDRTRPDAMVIWKRLNRPHPKIGRSRARPISMFSMLSRYSRESARSMPTVDLRELHGLPARPELRRPHGGISRRDCDQ